jgi:hypothetical protein
MCRIQALAIGIHRAERFEPNSHEKCHQYMPPLFKTFPAEEKSPTKADSRKKAMGA